MPELPEVENFKNYIDETSLHQKIAAIQIAAPELLVNTTIDILRDTLKGNVFEDTFRHGKFLFIRLLKNGFLMLHFGMTGDLLYYTPDKKYPKVYVLLIQFENGRNLAFSDQRRLGKIGLVKNVESFIKDRGYGKDALKISLEEFIALFQKRRIAIKTALMNQKIVAGVGNEFSDEILFQSKVHPESKSNVLPIEKLKEIYQHMLAILQEAIEQNADRSKLEHYFFLDHRKEGLKCPECKGETKLRTIGGRSSYFCPSCQKLYT
jgi:formamidopyrimidine-DNA glycosylase